MQLLSVEAKVLVKAFWDLSSKSTVAFKRPHILTEKARKGFDDLTKAGFLTVETSTRTGEMKWAPTTKMRDEKPRVTIEFVEANNFGLTTE